MKVDAHKEPAETIAGHLPALPVHLASLNALLDKRPIDLARAASLIRAEPDLPRRVTQLANSSAVTENSSLEEAVVTLGAERLRSIILIGHLIRITDDTLPPGAARAYWHHAFVVAALCRWLAVRSGYLRTETAYQAGFLHDIGRLALLAASGGQCGSRPPAGSCVLHYAFAESERHRLDRERTRLGADHAHIGGCIAAVWQLPAALCEAIACHHEPSNAILDPKLAAIVALADRVPFAGRNGAPDGDFVRGVCDGVERGLQALGITDPPLATLLDQQSLQGDLLDLWTW